MALSDLTSSKPEPLDHMLQTEATLNDNCYSPIPKESKQIRVLTLEPADNRDDPIVGNLSMVDLDDRTGAYNEALEVFHSGFSPTNQPELSKGPTRHVFWNFWNLHPEEARAEWDSQMAHDITEHKSLYDFCDMPLESFGDKLPDRFRWGDYLALSYVWGDQKDRKTITLNGSPFTVGQNLYDALLRLRASYEVSTRGLKMWIDAICINQNDKQERSTEVKKMDIIYSEALVTWGWLGQPPSTLSLHPIREMFSRNIQRIEVIGRGDAAGVVDATGGCVTEKQASDLINALGFSTTTNLRGPNPRQMLDTFQRNSSSDFATQSVNRNLAWIYSVGIQQEKDFEYIIWRVVHAMTQAPYWHRLWINQEIALSSSIIFWFGDFFLTSKEFSIIRWLFLSNLDKHTERIGQYVDQKEMIISVTNLGRVMLVLAVLRGLTSARCQNGRLKLKDVIDIGRESYATDQRDKVYGLLALLPQRIASQIKPSYEEQWTWQNAWKNFSRICIEDTQRLDMLGASSSPQGGITGLPSWAFELEPLKPLKPRLERQENAAGSTQNSFEGLVGYSPRRKLRQKSNADKGLGVFFNFSNDGQILHCKGLLIDTVDKIATISDRAGPTTETQSEVSSPNPLESTRLSIARTMVWNSTYQFSDGPSVLDVPYLNRVELGLRAGIMELSHMDRDKILNPHSKDYDEIISRSVDRAFSEAGGKKIPWRVCYLTTGFFNAWHEFIVPFQDFMIDGRPLRAYFDSQDEYCENWPYFQTSVGIGIVSMHGRRLFTTQTGRFGSVPEVALPGDKVAVINGCDVPVVLRPEKDGYKLVGDCFVDGLMNGEALDMLNRGEIVPMELAIY